MKNEIFTRFKKLQTPVYKIIGAAMTVHSELNWGLLEAVYTEALHLELLDRGIENIMEEEIPCYYKNRLLNKYYRADLISENILVEVKSVKELQSAHRAQLFNYLRLTKMPMGILLNFGSPSLQGERYAFIEESNECVLLDKDMNPFYEEDRYRFDEDESRYQRYLDEYISERKKSSFRRKE